MRQLAVIILILLFLPVFALAQFSEGAAYKSLKIYENKRSENTLKQDGLIKEYGAGAFNKCYICALSDEDNPFAVSTCLAETEYCLKDKAIEPEDCPEGYIFSAGRCIGINEGCKEQYGQYSYYLGSIDGSGNYTCGCMNGFGWNNDKSKCIQAGCPDGYIYYSQYKTSFGDFLHGRCMTRDQACTSEYGEFSYFAKMDADGKYNCGCRDGYDWGLDTAICEEVIVKGITSEGEPDPYEATVTQEKELTVATDEDLAGKLNGLILLQVEANGEAWYVNPDDQKRYFLSTPAKAFEVMRAFGMGTLHDFIETHSVYPEWVLGKILIDVEDSGKAYYIYPKDRKAYYLGRPEDAFSVMRNLGLGITNEDVRKIEVGEITG